MNLQNTNMGSMPQNNMMQYQELIKPWLELLKMYPQLTKEQLTPEMAQMIKNGMSPAVAYSQRKELELNNKIAQLQDIIRAMQINQKNKLTSIGGLSGEAINSDAFISGLSN